MNCGFHYSAEVACSVRKNAENDLTGTKVPLNSGLDKSAEVPFTDRQNGGNLVPLEMRGSRHGRSRTFRTPKCRK
jgi:hypothetical protein